MPKQLNKSSKTKKLKNPKRRKKTKTSKNRRVPGTTKKIPKQVPFRQEGVDAGHLGSTGFDPDNEDQLEAVLEAFGPSLAKRRPLTLEEINLTEEGEEILEVLRDLFKLQDASALASAYLELELIKNRTGSLEPDEEVPEEFSVDEFERISDSLFEIKSIDKLCKVFGLEQYSQDIIKTRIQSLFGKPTASKNLVSGSGKNFVGSDEGYLYHQLKQKLMSTKGAG